MRKIFVPREYQDLIIDHQIEYPRAPIHAGMGLGKTVSTLTSIDAMQLAGTGPALILAPLRVARTTWPQEAEKWDHLSGVEVSAVCGTETQRVSALRKDVGVYTTNYEQLPWLVKRFGKKWPFKIVVSDESTRLKGFRLRKGGQRAAALAKIQHLTDHWINLTGTPAPNGLDDLWGQMWFIDRGERLGKTYSSFRKRWFEVDNPYSDYPNWIPRDCAHEQIHQALADICLTIRSEDWFDLKAPIVSNRYFDLPDKARRHYDEMEKEMFTELESVGVEAFNTAAVTGKCGQIANGAMYTDDKKNWSDIHDQKLQVLSEIVDEAGGTPVLVAYEFVHDKARILKAFPKARALDDDPQTIADWNAGKIPMLVGHPQSAGHGLNLQDGGNIVAYFGLGWNFEGYDQMWERVGPVRQLQAGHDRNVFVYHILARDTVDTQKLERMTTKRSVQDILLDMMRVKR